MTQAVGLKPNGQVWSWGRGTFGAHGNNTAADYSSPITIVGNHSFMQIAFGNYGVAGLKQDGSVWCWGRNQYGGLGDQAAGDKSSPVLVVGNHSFVFIAKGHWTTAGLKADGSLWQWGHTLGRALGTAQTSSPILVLGNHSFIKIVMGVDTCMCLKSDGTAWGLGQGYNNAGAIGDGANSARTTPVAVVGSHSFIDIAAGFYTSYFLKADGSVWSCGQNDYGQLGDGTITNRNSPVAVIGSHSFCTFGSDKFGWTIGCIKENGALWTWGAGTVGALGNGGIANSSSPVAVIGGHKFVCFNTGEIFESWALKDNGEIWTWGSASYGELGNNTKTNTSSPVLTTGNHSFLTLTTGHRVCVDVNSTWYRQGIMKVVVNGAWKRVFKRFVNISGAWKE